MEPSPKVITLIRALTEATIQGKLEWTSAGDAAFIAQRPQGSVGIMSVTGSGNLPYEFTLYNNEAQPIESLRESGNISNPWDEPLHALYAAARANAFDIDTTIDTWIDDLKS
jgi:hypothetical protein